MAGWKKFLIGLLAMLIVFLLAAVLLVKLYVTPEKVHDLVQNGLEGAVQRPVSLGKVDIGLFTGVRLAKLRIGTKSGGKELLSAENVELSYDFKALLRGELLFNHIMINQPHLRLVREADGHLNIADLLEKKSAKIPPASVPGPAGSASAAKIPLRVKQFSLRGGTLLFIDRKLNPQSPYRYRLEKFDADVSDFSLSHPFKARLSASLQKSTLASELQFGFKDGLQRMQLHVKDLSLVPFLPYLRGFLPGSLGQGLLSTEITLKQQATGLAIAGRLMLDQVDLTLEQNNPLHWQKVQIVIEPELVYRRTERLLEVKKLQLDINGAKAAYRGKVALFDSVILAGEARIHISDLRKIATLLPLEMRQQFALYGVAGKLEATLQLEGSPQNFQLIHKATLKANDLQASFGKLRPALNGTLTYSVERLQGTQLKIDLNDQHLSVDLDATKILSLRPQLQLRISGDSLDLDSLLPQQTEQLAATDAKKVERPAPKNVVENPAPKNVVDSHRKLFSPPISGTANLKFAQIFYHGLSLEHVQGRATLQDGLLKIENLQAHLAAGVGNLRAVVDLTRSTAPFRGSFTLRGIDLAPVADAFFVAGKGSISGSLTADGDFSGLGGAQDLFSALQTSANFDLRDGVIKGSPLLTGLATFLTNSQLKVLGFNRLAGRLSLKRRQGTVDAQLESRRVLLASKGTFSLDGPLNIALEARIAPEIMKQAHIGGKGAELFKDARGWSLLPLKVKGRYSKPRFLLDSTGLKKQLKKGVTRELERQLLKKLGGKKSPEGNTPVQKLLDGTLQKLFGN